MDDNRACHIRSFNVEEAASLFTEVRGEGVFSEVRLNGVLGSRYGPSAPTPKEDDPARG